MTKPPLYRFCPWKYRPILLHQHGKGNRLGLLIEQKFAKSTFFEVIQREFVDGDSSWLIPECQVDPEIQDLIIDLNAAGFLTRGCCRGKYQLDDGSHIPGAYIHFVDWLPNEVKQALRANGIHVPPLMTDSAIAESVGHTPAHERINAFIPPSGEPPTDEDYAKNRAFESNVRAAFGALLTPRHEEIYGLLQTA